LFCHKLIITAALIRSQDDMDWSNFSGPITHSKEVGGKHAFHTSETVGRVTAVGSNKFAVGMVYLCARAGKGVSRIISPKGNGPGLAPKMGRALVGCSMGTPRGGRTRPVGRVAQKRRTRPMGFSGYPKIIT
jgi:hypothetical protein